MDNTFEGTPTQPDTQHEVAHYELPLSAREFGEQLARVASDKERNILSKQMIERSELETETPEIVGQELLQGLTFGLEHRDSVLLRRVFERMQAIVNRGSRTPLDFMKIADTDIEDFLNGETLTIHVASGTHGERIMVNPKERGIWMSGDQYGLEYRQNFVQLFKGRGAVADIKADDTVDARF